MAGKLEYYTPDHCVDLTLSYPWAGPSNTRPQPSPKLGGAGSSSSPQPNSAKDTVSVLPGQRETSVRAHSSLESNRIAFVLHGFCTAPSRSPLRQLSLRLCRRQGSFCSRCLGPLTQLHRTHYTVDLALIVCLGSEWPPASDPGRGPRRFGIQIERHKMPRSCRFVSIDK